MATKNLSASNLKQMHSKIFTTQMVHIDIDGKDYQVEVDTKFRISKLQELVSELIEKQKYFTDIKEVLSIPNYTMFLVIKYFSNIDVAKVEDFAEQLRIFEIMLDLGVVEKILKAIPEEEFSKVNDFIKKASENVKKITDNPEIQHELTKLFVATSNEFGVEESEETQNEDK